MNPTELAEKIAEACKDQKFKSFIIIGNRDIGMSTYALKLAEKKYLEKYYNS